MEYPRLRSDSVFSFIIARQALNVGVTEAETIVTSPYNDNNNLFSLSCTNCLVLCSLPHVGYVTIIWFK